MPGCRHAARRAPGSDDTSAPPLPNARPDGARSPASNHPRTAAACPHPRLRTGLPSLAGVGRSGGNVHASASSRGNLQSARPAAIAPTTGTPVVPPASAERAALPGYQGLSSRSSIQRQSGANGSSNHVGLPSAPARWTTDVSTAITRSRWAINAAVSAMSPISYAKVDHAPLRPESDAPPPLPSAAKRTQRPPARRAVPAARTRSTGSGPCGAPDCRPTPAPRAASPPATEARQPRRAPSPVSRGYGTRAGIVSTVVPNARGRLISGHCHANSGNASPVVTISTPGSCSAILLSGAGTSRTTVPPAACTSGT